MSDSILINALLFALIPIFAGIVWFAPRPAPEKQQAREGDKP